MQEIIEGFYFGRFQPPSKHHAEVVRHIVQSNPSLELIIGIASSDQTGKTQENFLYGYESKELFDKALQDLGIKGVKVITVTIDTKYPLRRSVQTFFDERGIKPDIPTYVFSGSPGTIKACEDVAEQFGLKIITLQDDDTTGPRGRMVRKGLIEGSDSWRALVTDSVADYLANPTIATRIRNLCSGEKRPWVKSTELLNGQ